MNPANRHYASGHNLTQECVDTIDANHEKEKKMKTKRESFSIAKSPKNDSKHLTMFANNAMLVGFTVFCMEARELIKTSNIIAKIRLMKIYNDGTESSLIHDMNDDTERVTDVAHGESCVWMSGMTFPRVPLDGGYSLYFDLYEVDDKKKENVFLGQLLVPARIIKATIISFGDKEAKQTKPSSAPVKFVRSRWEPLTPRKNKDGTEEPSAQELGSLLYIIAPAYTVLRQLTDKQMNPPTDRQDEFSRSSQSSEYSRSEMYRGGENEEESIQASLQTLSNAEKLKMKAAEKLLSPEDIQKKAIRRAKVVQEIVSTEDNYVRNLDAVCDCYISKLRPEMKHLHLSDEQVKALSLNIAMIRGFHQTFLVDLKKEPESTVKTIIKLSDFLRMYKIYVSSYPKMLETQTKLRKNKKFTEFMNKARANLPMDLMSLLIQPVQRIPRYVLLLKELKKWTLVSHDDFDALEEALAKVSKIALEINESKRQLENMSKLMVIQAGIKDDKFCFTLIVPNRILLKQGSVKMIQAKGLFGSMKISMRILYLFNDILLWTGTKNKYKGNMRIAAASIEEKDSSDTSIIISDSTCLLQVQFPDENTKDEWMALTQKAIKLIKAHRKKAMGTKMMRNRSINKSRSAHKQMLQSLTNANETGDFAENLDIMDKPVPAEEPVEAKKKAYVVRTVKSRVRSSAKRVASKK